MKKSPLKKGDKPLKARVALKTTKKLNASRHPIAGTSKRVREYNQEFEEMKPLILLRDGGLCCFRWRMDLLCAEPCGGGLHVHHRLLRSLGGSNSADNLITLCAAHHDFVHAHTVWAKERGLLLTNEAESDMLDP